MTSPTISPPFHDKPYEDNRKVRVAGPFTVESLSPHRVLTVDEDDELIDRAAKLRADYGPQQNFATMVLEQLATAGVQQAHKADRIAFAALAPWPGEYICAEGRYREGDVNTTLKAEIDADAWASLHSDLSRPFDRPASGDRGRRKRTDRMYRMILHARRVSIAVRIWLVFGSGCAG